MIYWENNQSVITYNDVIKLSTVRELDIESLYDCRIQTIDEERVNRVDINFPILVLVDGDTILSILDGNHRVTKAQRAGMSTMKCYVVDISSDCRITEIFK